MAGAPELSIIVFARLQIQELGGLLTALSHDPELHRAEVWIADASPEAAASNFARSILQSIRSLPLQSATMQTAKAAALQRVEAPLVAFLDATATPEPGWIGAILGAFSDPATMAVGGSVAYAGTGEPKDRAAYLFEYGAFAPPLEGGPTDADLPGNNVAYRRAELLQAGSKILPTVGFVKPFLHTRLRAGGGQLELHPDMRVSLRPHVGGLQFVRSRFHYGRCFGGRRRTELSAGHRFLLRLLGWTLPWVLFVRVRRRCLAHPETRRLWPGAARAVFMIAAAWGVGEWLGACFGPGRSCARVY